MRFAAVLLLLMVAAAEPVTAQATGLPTFFAPTRAFGSTEVGLTLSRPGGDATGIEGRFGAALDRADLAFRAGYVDPGGSGDGAFAAGIEARIPVLGHTESFLLDGGLILGVGRQFVSGGGQTFVPVGLSLGRRISLDGRALQITPYAQPTVVFAADALVTLGLGVDLHIRGIPEIRYNSAVGDMDGWSVSLFWAR